MVKKKTKNIFKGKNIFKLIISAIPIYIILYSFSYLIDLSQKTFGEIIGKQIILIGFSLLVVIYLLIYYREVKL